MNILDPKFRYVPAAKTDISKTFARVRKEINAARQVQGITGVETSARPAVAAPIYLRRKA